MCAGCLMTLFIRLAMIAFPNRRYYHCWNSGLFGRLAIRKLPSPLCTVTMVTKTVRRVVCLGGPRLRFGDKPKDVVVMAGDGGTADIGFQQVLPPGSGSDALPRLC